MLSSPSYLRIKSSEWFEVLNPILLKEILSNGISYFLDCTSNIFDVETEDNECPTAAEMLTYSTRPSLLNNEYLYYKKIIIKAIKESAKKGNRWAKITYNRNFNTPNKYFSEELYNSLGDYFLNKGYICSSYDYYTTEFSISWEDYN